MLRCGITTYVNPNFLANIDWDQQYKLEKLLIQQHQAQKHFDPYLYFGGVPRSELSLTNLRQQHRINEMFLGIGNCGSSEESDIFNGRDDSVLKAPTEEPDPKEAAQQPTVKNFLLLTPTYQNG